MNWVKAKAHENVYYRFRTLQRRAEKDVARFGRICDTRVTLKVVKHVASTEIWRTGPNLAWKRIAVFSIKEVEGCKEVVFVEGEEDVGKIISAGALPGRKYRVIWTVGGEHMDSLDEVMCCTIGEILFQTLFV